MYRYIEALPENVRNAAKKCLPFLAYRFANGPFRRLWIKRGVDPRSDVSFAKYQGHELRLPTEWFDEKPTGGGGGGGGGGDGGGGGGSGAGAKGGGGGAERRGQARVSTSHGEIHGFRALPASRYAVYQLCDVNLPGVQAVLSSLTAVGRCKLSLAYP